jgi:AAA domain
MTVRQQQARVTATSPVANGASPSADRSSHFSWEDWFSHASAQQRAEALGLAQQQGLLYPHQLPPITNGVKPTSSALKDGDVPPSILRLLAGKADTLPPLPLLEAITFIDAELDDLQRHAVVRALSTPDLLLLQGLPGTGKSRVVTEVILQASVRGHRILFLAGQAASLDVILHRLVDRPDVLALRFLDGLEKPESLPASLRGFTLDEQKRTFLDRVLAGARRNHEHIEATCRQHCDAEPLWVELRTCAERYADVEAKRKALETELNQLADAENANLPFTLQLADLRRSCDEAVGVLEATLRGHHESLSKHDQEAADLAARIAERESAYRAKKHGRFWTLTFWANLFNGSIVAKMDALLARHAECLAARQELAQQIDQVTEHQHRLRQQFNRERADFMHGEVQARRHTLEGERQQLDEQWTALCRRLGADSVEKTEKGLDAAREAWRVRKKNDEQQCQFAQQWTMFIEESGPSLAARLPSFANVLAGTVLRWHTDAKFRDAVASPVDLLIVEDAETLTEADLLKLSRHAKRMILVVQALAEPTPAPTVAEKASRALLAAPLVSAVCWHRLWQTLGGEAGRWPCTWQREHGRLVCQLFPLSAEDRQHLETESLADAPDIELRILHRAHTQPCLAQVIFAPHCTFEWAFSFMVREVQEFPLEPFGQSAWWSDEPQRFCRHLCPIAQRVVAWLTIEPGLRLGTVTDDEGEATRIGCIEFDKAHGWDRSRAEAWLHRHRPVRDHERTVFLQTPYRFIRPLAQFVESVVSNCDWLTATLPMPSTQERSFEFVAVPPLSKPEWPRDGAGLELDLSATRHADRLPVGLRQGLPARGFVNYLEAQALVRRLETCVSKEGVVASQVAVLALYEGQVELLRRLIVQSEILRASSFMPEVALPSRLHQRECDVVFLSLTRSHSYRCVAFGEDAKELPLALTRGRSRLFVFGDPGSLCKRTSWHGPLDQLDAPSAHQELVRLARLVAYLQKHAPTAPTNGARNGH